MLSGEKFEDTQLYKIIKNMKTKPAKSPHQREDIAGQIRESRARLLAHKIKLGGQENKIITYQDFLNFDKDNEYCVSHISQPREEVENIYNMLRNTEGTYIYGSPGSGKTSVLRYCTLRYCWLNKRNDVLICNFADAVRAMQADNFAQKDDILLKMKSCTFLFMDDLGTENRTEWTNSLLFQILDSRLFRFGVTGRALRTWFTSNIPPEELDKTYEPRIVRRILDNSKQLKI